MITVVDYGAGNIGSVLNMIRRIGGEGVASGDPEVVAKADKILLPGVGHFDNAMNRLSLSQLLEPLQERAAAGVPILGICLGMQLLADCSEEGNLPGLGLIPGKVRRFSFSENSSTLKIPHMGWNSTRPVKPHSICHGLESEAKFYFVHSYYFDCADPQDILFKTSYGEDFASGIQKDNVIGVQFHPEKSHRYGMQLLKNFIEL